ncbi:heterokaryon incompatibility protein-domain-containing protein [Lasiosphaeris hirsuta]|uniref:Heterokaryon incompatibility protein-domain-containing protein n=1 Tax=Lasiosphaeris hirsuta TaxID=260670 RepID=A0AA40E0V3_9PEZI|nr:heterokaryon incompatibility protein-domain-containing protein [Lasiosphaeris hirsuta]
MHATSASPLVLPALVKGLKYGDMGSSTTIQPSRSHVAAYLQIVPNGCCARDVMRLRPVHNVRDILRGRAPRSAYKYEPLPSPTSIRLLQLQYNRATDEIRCSLHPFEHKDAPFYHALSYTWGYPLTPFSELPRSTSFRRLNSLRKAAHAVHVAHATPSFLDGDDKAASNNRPADVEKRVRSDSRLFPISCDGQTMLITANLHDALRNMKRRAPGLKYLWVDAMCVDQENLSERNAQVAMMAKTFVAATSVIVWLGPEDQFTTDAIAAIDGISSMPKSVWKKIGYTDFFSDRWHEAVDIERVTYANWLGFLALIRRPWFRRAWVVQELALARSVTLVCGSHIIPWKKLNSILAFVKSKRWYHHLSTEKIGHIAEVQRSPGIYRNFLESKTEFVMAATTLASTRRHITDLSPTRPPMPLAKLIHSHRETLATDPRDKVYAFLGLADSPFLSRSQQMPIKADYSIPVHKVYTAISTSLMIAQGDLSLLSHVQDASRTRTPGIPSWVPDYSVVLHPYPLALRGNCRWSACGELSWQPPADASTMRDLGLLSARGYRVGVVRGTARMPDEVMSQAAYWAHVVDLAAGLGRYYPFRAGERAPKVSRVEVLWRTLVANTYSRTHVAPDECGTLFIDYVLNLQIRHTLTPWAQAEKFLPHQSVEAGEGDKRIVPAWHKLLESEPSESPYSPSMYRARIASVVERMFRGTYAPIELAQLQHEFDMTAGDMRRMFRTDGGLLGAGPRSVAERDEVWILGGAVVPVVLRRVGNGRHRLVGEAYVHGYMHSNRRDADDMLVEMEDIVIE